ncbi:hypothetical protein [Hyalangium gracile]|uniref:hypothetical protein n=1 Tax=Hyalangium gracile TaxID=394092 RepID=UPI001CCB14B4|nr:hypothetical protein [Hyalangium gracile]
MRHEMIPRAWVLLACWLCVGGMPRSAFAEGAFERSLQTAVRLYESLEFEKALEELQKARRRARGTEQEVSIYLHEGIFLGDMGEREQSRAAFRKGLLLKPEAILPLLTSPKLERDFEEIRGEVIAELARERRDQESLSRASGSGDRPELTARPNLKPPETAGPEFMAVTEEARARSRVPVAPLVLAGVGVLSAGAGAVFGLQSRSNASKVGDAYAGRLPSSTEVRELRSRLDAAGAQAFTASVLFGTAALAAGGAVVTWLLTSDHPGPNAGEIR